MTSFNDAIANWFYELGDLNVISAGALGLFFTFASFVVFPRTILILTAGATFGLTAAPVILLGGTVGGILAFLRARYVARDWFQRKMETRNLMHAFARAIDKEGWHIVALARLGAPVPSAIQNYMFGLTNIGLRSYSISTLIFSAPQILLFTFLGASGRDSVLSQASVEFSLLAIGLTLAIIALISLRVRMFLNQALAPQRGSREPTDK